MKRRGRIVTGIVLVLVGLPLLLVGILATPPMTKIVVRRALPAVNDQLNGTLTVAEIGGSLLGRVHLGGVTVRDPRGEIVVQADHIALNYGLWDLLKGRITLGPVLLDRPVVRLVKDHPGEPYSLLRVFAQEKGDSAAEPGTVDLSIRDVNMREGTVIVTVWREPAAPRREGAQALDTVRLEHLNLDLPLIHYSARPGEERLALLDIASARGRLADPVVELHELYGEAELRGDSITIALERIQLPASQLEVGAWIVTDPERRRFSASARVQRLVAADIAGLISGADIPPDWAFAGDIRASSRVDGEEGVSVTSPNLNLQVAGGSVRGVVTVVGADDEWNAQASRVEVAGVQVAELLRAFGLESTLRARVDGVITADGQAGAADLQVAGLAGYGVRGAARGHIRARGSFDAMALDTRLEGAFGRVALVGRVNTGRHLELRGVRGEFARLDLAAISTDLPASSLNGRVAGDVTFGSLPRDGRVELYLDSSTIAEVQIDTAVVTATAENGFLTTDTILIRSPGLTVAGTGTLREDSTGALTLDVNAPSLDALGPLVGALTGDSLPGLAGALQLDVTAQGSLTRFTLDATVEGKDLAVGGFEVETLEGRATGPPDSLRIAATAALDDETTVQVAGGRVDSLVTVDSLRIARGDAVWALDPAATVELRGGVWRFENATLRSDDAGTITVAGAHPGPLSLTADRLQLSALLNRDDDLPRLSGSARREGERWTGSLTMATLSAEFRTNPLNARIRADSFDLSVIEDLAPTLRDVTGHLDGDVTVEGAADAPRLRGTLALHEASARVPATGVFYEHVNARFRFSGDALTIERMETEAGGGTATVAGRVRFATLDQPEVDLRVSTRQFPVMNRRDFLQAAATSELRLVGTRGTATLTGRAQVVEGSVYLDEFLRPSGIDLSDPLYAQFVDTTVLAREVGGQGGLLAGVVDSLVLDDVTVSLGDKFWLRSPDAQIQLGGRVTLSSEGGADGGYELVGTVEAVRGLYRLVLAPGVTREFAVRDGTIQFFGGGPPADARLDLTVNHELTTRMGEDLTITAHITGTVAEPVLELTSDVTPRLSETEIISYLVFGAPTVQAFLGDEEETGERRSVFEQSAQRLAGVLSGRIESAVQDELGLPIDYFRIKPGEVQSGLAGTELVFGAQVRVFGRPSFLRVGPRFCPREEILSLDHIGIHLETRLSPQWGVTTSVEPVQGCEAVMSGTAAKPYQLGADVFWEFR